jgi:hypothetical protein
VLGVALHSGTVEDVAGFVRERGVECPTVIGDDGLAERFEDLTFTLEDLCAHCSEPIRGEIRSGEIAALASLDEDSGGAFVKITFASAERELFVRLDGDERIRQLTYVPPDVQ